ncbi:heterokaryon incompatibility protein-domain-containing protein [Nemania sp. NC0429]|nr:heterokaryon incompatibility protein-domain-containing protein [Nemania sp. NC0429]
MSVCDPCRQAALWGTLSKEDKRRSGLTAARPTRLGDRPTIHYHSSFADLDASSTSCVICKSLFDLIPEEEADRLLINLVQTRIGRSRVACLEAEFWQKDMSDFGIVGVLRGGEWMLGACNAANPLAERALWSKESASLANRLPVLRHWLEKCEAEHPSCKLSTITTRPARFLEISTTNQDIIRLVPSDKLDTLSSTFRYIALSHCWGSSISVPLTTKQGNYDANTKGIRIDSLPKTFKDSVLVARGIGVRYLWIDSLCIVQDNEMDWVLESAKMAHVYQGSYFTIAATSSAHGGGGLFLDLPVSTIKVTRDDHEGVKPMTQGILPDACFIRQPIASRQAIWNSPLTKRAWVLQEQILSNRLIHFTNEQMYFQCHDELESEDGTICDKGFNSLQGTARVSEGEIGMGKRDFSKPIAAIGTWWSWVTEYSSRALTFHKDRMAAIAGIVKYYGDRTAQEPILGLWKDTIWYDLGWHVESDLASISHDHPYISNIPRWSWLSIQPSITVDYLTGLDEQKMSQLQIDVSLIKWDIEWEGPAYTSKLLSSTLVVAGAMKSLGFPLPHSRSRNRLNPSFEAPWDDFLSFTVFLDFQLTDDQRGDLFVLRLFHGPVYEYFLLMMSQVSDSGVVYQRVGSGNTHRPKGRSGLFEAAVSIELTLI